MKTFDAMNIELNHSSEKYLFQMCDNSKLFFFVQISLFERVFLGEKIKIMRVHCEKMILGWYECRIDLKWGCEWYQI